MLKHKILTKLILIIFIVLYCFISCNTTDPPIDKAELTLKLEEVSCTEAWITLTANNLQLPATLYLLKDNTITKTINLQTADTLLFIDSLLPNQTYQYLVSSIQNPSSSTRSNELSVTTLDTTSHDFTWQTWTFGGTAGSSTLYDVAIVSENCLWAVGEIYVADSSINGYTKYCYLKWNGTEWELGKLKYFPPGSIGDSITTSGRSVFAFSEDDVWISGGAVFHWNGSNWKIYYNTGAESSNTIWGASSNNLYFVGRNGNIIHYNGSQWSKIESGTSLNIGDIWGIENNDGGYNKYLAADDALLMIDNENNLHRINAEQGHSLLNVWGNNDRLLYTAGGTGLVLYKNYRWEKINRPDLNSVYGIKGNEYNDVFGLSATRMIIHFNGVNWELLNKPQNNSNVRLNVKDNLIASVGWQLEKAVVTLLKRNN